MKPVSGLAKIELNRKPVNVKTSVVLEFDDISFDMDSHQYRDFWFLIKSVEGYDKRRKVLCNRPDEEFRTSPRAWFRYLGTSCLIYQEMPSYWKLERSEIGLVGLICEKGGTKD